MSKKQSAIEPKNISTETDSETCKTVTVENEPFVGHKVCQNCDKSFKGTGSLCQTCETK